jgi:hypothetical protein
LYCAPLPLKVIYYGFDKTIPVFLREQPFVQEVREVYPRSKEDYWYFIDASCGSDLPIEDWAPELLRGTGLSEKDLCIAHVDYYCSLNPANIHLWDRPAVLPVNFPKKTNTLLLHPRSEQSYEWHTHWPWWYDAIDWLLENTDYTLLLTGVKWTRQETHPRLVNLVGQTGSMMDVLALAESCEGVITTCSALALWSVIQDIPSLVCMNQMLSARRGFFRRWIENPPNVIVEYGEDLSIFVKQFAKLETEREKRHRDGRVQILDEKPEAASGAGTQTLGALPNTGIAAQG